MASIQESLEEISIQLKVSNRIERMKIYFELTKYLNTFCSEKDIDTNMRIFTEKYNEEFTELDRYLECRNEEVIEESDEKNQS